jgi:proline-specific peptidase
VHLAIAGTGANYVRAEMLRRSKVYLAGMYSDLSFSTELLIAKRPIVSTAVNEGRFNMAYPVRDGTVPFHLPSIDKPCFTYYKIVGDLSSGKPPLVLLHGGPGGGHGYLLPFAKLWIQYGIPCIFYDQIGCGLSTHLPETAGNEELWREEIFLSELENLIDHLSLSDEPGYYLLGQSFGGMMGAAFATWRPKGLRRLVLASALASKALSQRSVEIRKSELPVEVQNSMKEAEATDDYESPGCKDAMLLLYRRFLCRVNPFPEELMETLRCLKEAEAVYKTMYIEAHFREFGWLADVDWQERPFASQTRYGLHAGLDYYPAPTEYCGSDSCL